jgi:phosphotransacetylase
MKISSFKELAQAAASMEKKTIVAVVEAQDEHTLEAVTRCTKDGIISPLLIGNEGKIREILASLGEKAEEYEIVDSPISGVLRLAVEFINAGRANCLMKGKLETGQFMKAVVNKENGLMKGGLLSVVGLYEMETYPKIFAVSDQGLNTYPDLEAKKKILANAVKVMHAIGVEEPKVAVLSSVEKVNPKMPDAVDAGAIKEAYLAGEFDRCIVEGPISFDLATDPNSCKIKGYDSPVGGDADVLIAPDICCGNVLVKALTGLGKATTAGGVFGAKVPIIMVSRSAEASDKYYSIALAAYTAGKI